MKTRHLFPILACLFVPAALHAQSVTTQQAMTAYEANDFATCAKLFGELADSKVPADSPDYNAACCHALAGEKPAALSRLRKAISSELTSVQQLENDADLASLRTEAEWPGLIELAKVEEDRRLAGVDRALREELLQRQQKDQAARQVAIDANDTAAAWKQVEPIDHDNTAWLKQVIATRGWPGNSMVGKDGASAAWLLVQHADADPAFQAQVLPLMEAAVARHDASPSNYALLTDRVLRAQGKPQRYGTQFQTGDDGSMSMQPTEDEAGLDTRRAAVGLPPIAEYKQMLEEMYHQPVK